MDLAAFLRLATEELTKRLNAERESRPGWDASTRYWLLVKDALGVELTDFDERDLDASEVLERLLGKDDVQAAALVTRHSGSELLLAGHLRQGPSVAYKTHVVPRLSREEEFKLAPWEPL